MYVPYLCPHAYVMLLVLAQSLNRVVVSMPVLRYPVENEKLKKDLAEIEEKQKSLEKKHAQELKSALDDLEAAQEAHKMEIAILHDTLAEQSELGHACLWCDYIEIE